MHPMEIIAVFFALLVLFKIFVLIFAPRSLARAFDVIIRNQAFASIITAVIAFIVGYYLLQVMHLVTLFVAVAFASLLFRLSMFPYLEALRTPIKRSLSSRDTVLREWGLQLLVWGVLSLWVLIEILG